MTPAIAAVFLVITLSSIGLPGTNGFVGEFLILIGTWSGQLPGARWMAALAATGVILGAVYMLWMYQRVMLGPVRRESVRKLPDLSLREWATFAPLLIAIVAIGVFPQPLLNAVKNPVDEFVQRVLSPPDRRRVVPTRQPSPLDLPQRQQPLPSGLPTQPGDEAPPPRVLFPRQVLPRAVPSTPPNQERNR